MALVHRDDGRTVVSPSFSALLLLVAIVLFVLFACGVDNDTIHLGWLGLAFFAGAFLVP